MVTVVKGESVEVQCEGEEEIRVLKTDSNDSLPLLRNPEILVGANNLTTLSYLHEPAGTYTCACAKFEFTIFSGCNALYMYVRFDPA